MNSQNNPKNQIDSAISNCGGNFEISRVTTKKVSCNGGKVTLGHPLIYLDMGKKDFVVCPYCSRFFTTNHKIKH
jgi:uncharacterized Zn-finger protein